MQLVKLLPMLSQETVETYFFNKRESYGALRDIILRI